MSIWHKFELDENRNPVGLEIGDVLQREVVCFILDGTFRVVSPCFWDKDKKYFVHKEITGWEKFRDEALEWAYMEDVSLEVYEAVKMREIESLLKQMKPCRSNS